MIPHDMYVIYIILHKKIFFNIEELVTDFSSNFIFKRKLHCGPFRKFCQYNVSVNIFT